LKKDLGSEGAPLLEQLLIQQAALCWLKLNLVELGYSNTMKQSITLTLGVYWEKRLTAAQRRFTRSCETLARVRKLSRNTPALQFNIAAIGGQQINVSSLIQPAAKVGMKSNQRMSLMFLLGSITSDQRITQGTRQPPSSSWCPSRHGTTFQSASY
jgi:hypothetical protein